MQKYSKGSACLNLERKVRGGQTCSFVPDKIDLLSGAKIKFSAVKDFAKS